jgi:hypothetical protein
MVTRPTDTPGCYLAALAVFFQGQESVPGVITRPLGPCDVAWFENKGGALVFGCPHMDMLKLWPLPMEQAWWEDLLVRPGERVGRFESQKYARHSAA